MPAARYLLPSRRRPGFRRECRGVVELTRWMIRACRISACGLFEETVLRARQAEVFAQGAALVFAAEEAAALQFGDDPVDKIVEAAGDIGEHDVEPVAGARVE